MLMKARDKEVEKGEKVTTIVPLFEFYQWQRTWETRGLELLTF